MVKRSEPENLRFAAPKRLLAVLPDLPTRDSGIAILENKVLQSRRK
jgi:hypothetical protein